MRRIDLFVTLFAILLSNCVYVLVLALNSDGENRHPILKIFNVSCLVFREVHIDKASHTMSISCVSHIAVLVVIFVDNLLV